MPDGGCHPIFEVVAHASEWPGVHSVREILAGEPIRGLWYNRTQESAARKRGEAFERLKYATEETFELTPLPCWAHLTPEDYRKRVAELVEAIESEARAELASSPGPPGCRSESPPGRRVPPDLREDLREPRTQPRAQVINLF